MAWPAWPRQGRTGGKKGWVGYVSKARHKGQEKIERDGHCTGKL